MTVGCAAAVADLLAGEPIVRRKLKVGDALFHQGDVGDAAQLVLRGLVGLQVSASHREPLVAVLLHPGGLAAPECLIRPGTQHQTTARALTDCEIQLLRASAIGDDRRRYQLVDVATAVLMAQRGEILDRLVDSAHRSAGARVAGALRRLVGDAASAEVTQDIVAEVAAVVRVTANAELRRLAERRIIRLDRKRITIVDRPALDRLT